MGSMAYEREMSTLPTLLQSMALLYLFTRGILFSTCPFVHPFVHYQIYEHAILKTN